MPLTIRLVKGAYWDHELVQAAQHGWSAPVFERKADTDANFELLTRRLLDARPALRVAIASHNLRSIAHAIAYNRLTGGADEDLELQVLRGLGDPLQAAIAAQGLRVRTYCPVGDLVAGMAYLVRRLLENTSNESFLYEQARGVPLEELLAAPAGRSRAPLRRFTNEPILELRRAPVRAQLAGALEAFDAEPVIQVPVWVGDDTRTGGALVSTDPGEPERVVAESAIASEADVDHALDLAARSDWRRRPAAQRAEVLVRAAQWLRERRLEIAALEVRETAKPWREADADVCEAIDFLEYYARGAIALEERPAGDAELIQLPGERNELRWAPRGDRRRDLALELPGRDPARDGRGRAGDRQRGGAEAGRAGARVRVRARARAARVRPARRARWRCCPARGRSARSWSATRACTRSRSPAPARSGWRSCAARRRWRPGSGT